MIIHCSNNRTLSIVDRENDGLEIECSLIPYVVMLTAWNSEEVSKILHGNLVRSLILKGARNFVCLGALSEQLHDGIDDIIYQIDDEIGSELTSDILTSFHSDESIEDGVNYYVFGTQFNGQDNSFLLAILSRGCSEDREVRSFLETA